MSNVGQAVLTIVGTVVGTYIGYPQLGFIAGSLLGGALFPTKLPGASGPRLGDARTTTAQMGGPVMEVFGTDAVPGNVMWMDDIEEVTNTDEVGGKGAPSQKLTTYSYFQSIAIGICRGPMGGLLRVWENGVVVYDARPQLDTESNDQFAARVAAANDYAEGFELYLGTSTQLPSPTIELDKGVGNTPAFRDLMYIVYPRRQLKEEQALRHPNFKFEVSQLVTSESIYSNAVLDPWTGSDEDPRYLPGDALGGYTYRYNVGSGPDGTTFGTLAAAIVEGNTASNGVIVPGTYNYKVGYAFSDSGLANSDLKMSPGWARDPVERVQITLYYNRYLPDHYEGDLGGVPGGSVACSAFEVFDPPITGGPSARYWWSGIQNATLAGTPYGSGVWRLDTFENTQIGEYGTNNCAAFAGSQRSILSPDVYIKVARIPHIPEGDWVLVSGSFKVLAAYADDGTSVTQYPLNPCLPAGSDNDTMAYWTAAYNEAVTAGDMPAGKTYGVDYPVAQAWAYQGSSTAIGQPIALSEVVRPICVRAGMLAGDVDVSDLTDDFITGYTITRVMAAKDALDPLRQVGFFDIIESGDLLKFPQRGGPVVRRLATYELGAGEIDADPGPAIKISYTDETTLPRIVRLHYKAPSRDYEDGEQISPARSTTLANNDLDVEVAVAMGDDQAAQVAEVLWADAWEAGTQYEIALDQYHVDLESGDVLEIPIDGFYERTRILDIDEAIPMLRTLRLARDFDGTFVSEAVADPPEREPGAMRVYSQSIAILLDIPSLRVEDNDAGIYVTAVPTDPGADWRAAALYRSIDSGLSYDAFGSVSTEPTTAEVLAPLGVGQWFTWDDTQTIDVELLTGNLESRTEAAILAGANAMAVGAAGRWEIIQFTTVEQLSATQYRLSHLLRGRLGTEVIMGTGIAGDMAVLVSGNGIVRVPLTNADIDLASLVRAVTSGLTFADAADQDFTDEAVALKPFAPVHLQITPTDAGDQVLTWERRDRLYQTLQGGVLPLSEATEEYEIEIVSEGVIIDAATVVDATQYAISPVTFAYELPVSIQFATSDGASDVLGLNQGTLSASIRRYDATTGAATGGMGVGDIATGFVVIGGFAFVTVINVTVNDKLYRIDLAAITPGAILTSTHNLLIGSSGLSTDGLTLIVSDTSNDLVKFVVPADLTVTHSTAVVGGPCKSCVSPDLATVYVCCRGSDEIAILDIASFAETGRFNSVVFPLDIVVTPTLVFVQGTYQLGIYTHAGVVVALIDITQTFSGGPQLQYLAYDGARVLAIDGIDPILVRFYDGVTGEEQINRDLGVRSVGGFAADKYYFCAGPLGGVGNLGEVYDGSLPDGYLVRVYQISAVVGRGSPGVLQT